MAKDYFQDIIPPQDGAPQKPATRVAKTVPVVEEVDDDTEVDVEPTAEPVAPPERSIRNIEAPQRVVRSLRPSVSDPRGSSMPGIQQLPPKPPRKGNGIFLWVLAGIVVLVLGGLALFALRKTTVTVVPRSHTIVFDQTAQFSALPASAGTPGPGQLSYSLASVDLQDSQVVPATGTQNVQTKAEGTITVYNDYSQSPVKLIKNTRFQSPGGVIFRVPADVIVPGKIGSTPGSVMVTIVADQAGDQYNVGPVARFTVPGLQSDPAMYSNVYARSTASTTGGFIGTQPVADPVAVQSAISDIRSRLEQKARNAAANASSSSLMILPDLVQITYQDLPQTNEAGSGAQVNEVAHVVIPEFDAGALAQAIAFTTSADAQGAALTLVPGPGFKAEATNVASSTLGTAPIVFSLSGNATLIWQVDATALAAALAGRSENSFQTIANGFVGVQEAHARIEPFWKTTFPGNPADITVVIEPPQPSK